MFLKNKALQKLWDGLSTFNSYDPMAVVDLFKECDEAIEGEIAAIKAELTDANKWKNIYHDGNDRLRNMALERCDELRKANNQIESLKKMIDELKEKLNNERKHGEDLADVNSQLASENVDLAKENGRLREVIGMKGKEINNLKKKIHELEGEIDNLNKDIDELTEENTDIEVLQKSNNVLRRDNETLWERLKEADVLTRPWHGDGNATPGVWTYCKSLADTIEFQNKKIEELEAEKARLKEAYDIHETTIKRLQRLLGKERKEKENLMGDHKIEFGDVITVPWSSDRYMYIAEDGKHIRLYNITEKHLCYIGAGQHLNWTGERFEIK